MGTDAPGGARLGLAWRLAGVVWGAVLVAPLAGCPSPGEGLVYDGGPAHANGAAVPEACAAACAPAAACPDGGTAACVSECLGLERAGFAVVDGDMAACAFEEACAAGANAAAAAARASACGFITGYRISAGCMGVCALALRCRGLLTAWHCLASCSRDEVAAGARIPETYGDCLSGTGCEAFDDPELEAAAREACEPWAVAAGGFEAVPCGAGDLCVAGHACVQAEGLKTSWCAGTCWADADCAPGCCALPDGLCMPPNICAMVVPPFVVEPCSAADPCRLAPLHACLRDHNAPEWCARRCAADDECRPGCCREVEAPGGGVYQFCAPPPMCGP